jgi:hypothetical protein
MNTVTNSFGFKAADGSRYVIWMYEGRVSSMQQIIASDWIISISPAKFDVILSQY